jgi:excinuclease ABC subunit C
MENKFDIEEELKKLPASPGVYIMHDEKDEIIYVGKAIVLKNRVRSYFRKSTQKTTKIQRMVSLISRFEYIVTDSELEALVLENNLIKEHAPKYNTMLKDDKTYPFIRVTMQDAYPRIHLCRYRKKDGAKYFGPFISNGAVKDTIEFLNKTCKLRTCNRNIAYGKQVGRPCLNFQMNKCCAPCRGVVTKEEYALGVKKALDFLKGDDVSLFKELTKNMEEASERLDFEQALIYRDLLSRLKSITQKQKMDSETMDDKDVIALAVDGLETVVQIFFIRNRKLIGREHYYMKNAEDEKKEDIISIFMKQFYAGASFVPREILIQTEIEEREVLEKWLSEMRGRKVYIHNPKKGTKEKLLELATENACLILSKDKERMKAEKKKTLGAVKELGAVLGLDEIQRIEAYDISNTSGYESVGSMVVFEEGKPKKSDYRKFKIRSVKGPDDYASLEEVLFRRFRHGIEERKRLTKEEEAFGSFTKFPSVIMMDGGKGQVHIAEKVLQELNLKIPVCGMVKDDTHTTRGLYYQGNELKIPIRSEGFHLLTKIQDEAHRFAITYHRAIRSKKQVYSVLDEIKGIGEARRKDLLRAFGSVPNIQKASEEELKSIGKLSGNTAKAVHDFFHKTEEESL